MFALQPLAGRASPRAWTCFRCSLKQSPIPQSRQLRAAFASKSQSIPRLKTKKAKNSLVAIVTTSLAGYGLINYTDGGNFVYGAVQRTGRVMSVLVANINDYRTTLQQSEKEEYDDLLTACHKRCAERTLVAMEKNGSIFIKLGQHLTSLNYLLPNEWCDTFIPLQDKCPTTTFNEIKSMVERDTQVPFEELFTDFQEKPLGAASLAQVHLATDKASGQRVAVKCQHPVLDDWAPLDLALTRFTINTLKRVFPDYDLTWLSDEMEVSLPQELDFALEGINAKRAKEYFAPLKDCPLVVPTVLWARRRVVVMEYLTGARLDDLAYLDSHNIDRDEVSAALSRIFNTMIFAPDAPLHCDPHGGNIAIRHNPSHYSRHNFDVILYDHGLYRVIPRDLQRSYAKLWLAVLAANEADMRKYSKEIAGITDEQFPLFASAITGRDYTIVTQDLSSTPRSAAERDKMSKALGEGLLQQLVHLLGQVPRIILLILKTNDLTRSLDTKLHSRRGPMRSFLILARYAARTVLDEQLENLRRVGSLFWPPSIVFKVCGAYARYGVVVSKLQIYEFWLYARGLVGLDNEMPGNPLQASG